jgi:hypothetical protein
MFHRFIEALRAQLAAFETLPISVIVVVALELTL